MKVLCFGSLNIDYVYQVPRFVSAGETLAAGSLRRFSGGKGLNQSVALAKAGAAVFHAGKIGADGAFLEELLQNAGVDTSLLLRGDTCTGHAVIQVEESGENCILLAGGANQEIAEENVERALSQIEPGDWLLLQNEISAMAYILDRAAALEIPVALNPSPMTPALPTWNLSSVRCFLLNKLEGRMLAGETNPEAICLALEKKYPEATVVLTLGADGVLCRSGGQWFRHGVYPVEIRDTTGAGDSFVGGFLRGFLAGWDLESCGRFASAVAAHNVSAKGAAAGVPDFDTVLRFLTKKGFEMKKGFERKKREGSR